MASWLYHREGDARCWPTLPKQCLSRIFAGRVLPFNAAAAARYAKIPVERRRSGNPNGVFDALVAATALAAGASIATRDTDGFEGCGLTVINPWTSP